MKVKVILRHGEYQDIQFEDMPIHIPLEVEIIEEEE